MAQLLLLKSRSIVEGRALLAFIAFAICSCSNQNPAPPTAENHAMDYNVEDQLYFATTSTVHKGEYLTSPGIQNEHKENRRKSPQAYPTNEPFNSNCTTTTYEEFLKSFTYTGKITKGDFINYSFGDREVCFEIKSHNNSPKQGSDKTCVQASSWRNDTMSNILIKNIQTIISRTDRNKVKLKNNILPLSHDTLEGNKCSVVVEDHSTYAIFSSIDDYSVLMPITELVQHDLGKVHTNRRANLITAQPRPILASQN